MRYRLKILVFFSNFQKVALSLLVIILDLFKY